MDGIHDLGGMDGFGPVEREVDEPVFHHPWEGRAYGLVNLTGLAVGISIDRFRHAIERLPPKIYLSSSYYERWIRALQTLLVETGVLTRAEVEDRLQRIESGDHTPAAPLARSSATAAPPARGTVFRELDRPPRFALGDAVTTRGFHPRGHTRLPRYARGKRGTVVDVYPPCVFPDTNAHDRGEEPQHLYCVAFTGEELWGAEDAEPGTSVRLDLFEPYLEPCHD